MTLSSVVAWTTTGAPDRAPVGPKSESCQPLRTVVRYRDAGALLERAVRLGRVAHQLRGIAVDLVEIGAIRRNPAIGWSAGDGRVETSSGAIARHLRACGI